MTSTETTDQLGQATAPAGRYPYLADAGRQRDQLDRLLAWKNQQKHYMHVDRDPDVLEQLVDAGYVRFTHMGYALTPRGEKLALNLAEIDAYQEHAERERADLEVTQQLDAVVEQTGILPAEGTLDEATLPGRHRIVKRRRTPGWPMVACLAVLTAFDGLITRVAYRIARFVTVHARGLAWFVIVTPALAAGLVLGTTGVLWVIR